MRLIPCDRGQLQLPAKVTRYIDANPVDIQLDIPLLGQFRIYLFVPDIRMSLASLKTLCKDLVNSNMLGKAGIEATQSYMKKPRGLASADDFVSPHRYVAVSEIFTYAMVTQSARSEFEIADLPGLLQDSRWTLYLDDLDSCTKKWFGNLEKEQFGVAIVRPDGYCGAMKTWGLENAGRAAEWMEEFFSFMI